MLQREAAELVNSDAPSNSTNIKEDLLSQLLGPDNPGRLRTMGRNLTMTKLACFQMKNKCLSEMQDKQIQMQQTIHDLRAELNKIKNQVTHSFLHLPICTVC